MLLHQLLSRIKRLEQLCLLVEIADMTKPWETQVVMSCDQTKSFQEMKKITERSCSARPPLVVERARVLSAYQVQEFDELNFLSLPPSS
jgi:hypothetical protein